MSTRPQSETGFEPATTTRPRTWSAARNAPLTFDPSNTCETPECFERRDRWRAE